MIGLTSTDFQNAFNLVNQNGYASLKLPEDVTGILGEPLYKALENVELPSNRPGYYNELSLFWPEDWTDSSVGPEGFHDEATLRQIHPVSDAKVLLGKSAGDHLTRSLLDFAQLVNQRVVENHHGLKNNELRLARVMIRQMSPQQRTMHSGSVLHEDQGYKNRSLRQLVSGVVTTYGKPTQSEIHQASVGELLLFNARDRREELGLPMNRAFLHKGPESGPKMFLFFEFLGPSPS